MGTGREKWDFETFTHPRFLGDSWMWWREFLDGKADKTRRNYIKSFMDFLEVEDYTTETLFEEHRDNSKHDDPRHKKRLGSKVYRYQKMIMDEGKSSGSADNVAIAIKSFFRANEMDFRTNGNIKVISEEIPTIGNEELKLILDVCGSVRLKAGIHVLKESGMRISDLCQIKVSDIEEALTGDLDFFTWTFIQQKTGRRADPVIGGEAIRWLKFWITKRELDGIESEWVFCTVQSNDDNQRIRGRIAPASIGQLFRHYRDKAGLRDTGVSIHSLRKRHKTLLEYSGIPTSWINKMQGRVGQGTGGAYTKPNPEQLIEMYKRGYEELTIEDYSSKDEQLAEMKELRTDVEDLKETLRAIQAVGGLVEGSSTASIFENVRDSREKREKK